MNKKTVLWLVSLVVILIVSLIVLIPVLRPGLLVTDDGHWMVIRLSAFYQSLREGQFPVRFLGRLNQSYGYPVANFLYPGFLYIGSVLHAIGLSFQTSIEAVIVGSVLFGAIGMYLFLRLQFSNKASLIGALSYVLMPYFLFDIFKRGSVGEVLVLGLVPMVFYAIESKKKWLVPLIVGLLAISHNTLAAFFIPMIGVYILLKKYWDLIPSMVFGVGMSLFFWLPAFFERIYVTFDTTVISNPGAYFSISNAMITASIPFLVAWLSVAFGKMKEKKTEALFFLAVMGISVFFATKGSSFFWRISDFVKFIQFPFRWLSLAVIAGPWLVAYAVYSMKRGVAIIVSIGLLFLTSSWYTQYFNSESVVEVEGYFTTNEATTTVHDEYMPRWSSKHMTTRSNKKVEFFKGNGVIEVKNINTQTIDVVVNASEKSIMQINTVYYPGWGISVDGAPVKIDYDNPYGFMRFPIPEGKHHVFMEFRETPGRFLADLASMFFGVLYVISCVVMLVTRKPKKAKKRIGKKI